MPAGVQTTSRRRSWNDVPVARSAIRARNDVAAVAIGEAFPGCELLRVPIEDVEIGLGRREPLRRDGQQVVRQVQLEVLVEVVADP
jgi:hypothetical protein